MIKILPLLLLLTACGDRWQTHEALCINTYGDASKANILVDKLSNRRFIRYENEQGKMVDVDIKDEDAPICVEKVQ